jgi:predicted metal-binding protein
MGGLPLRHFPVPFLRDDDARSSFAVAVMDGAVPVAPVELLVCVTCRSALPAYQAEAAEAPRAGAALLEALQTAGVPDSVRVVPVECLSNCTRGCTVALRAPGRWSYVYGNLDVSLTDVLVEGVARYAAAPDGLVPWRERPEHFRKNCIARLPPLEG